MPFTNYVLQINYISVFLEILRQYSTIIALALVAFLIVVVVCGWISALRSVYQLVFKILNRRLAWATIKAIIVFTIGLGGSWILPLVLSEDGTYPVPSENLGIMTLGYLALIGVPWQLHVLLIVDREDWDNNQVPGRLISTFFICFIIIAGILLLVPYKIIDPQTTFQLGESFTQLWHAVIFSIIFLAKTYISIIVSCSSLGLIIYDLTHNAATFDLDRSLEPIIGWTLNYAPDVIQELYTTFSTIYLLCISQLGQFLSKE